MLFVITLITQTSEVKAIDQILEIEAGIYSSNLVAGNYVDAVTSATSGSVRIGILGSHSFNSTIGLKAGIGISTGNIELNYLDTNQGISSLGISFIIKP
jgi:hypothetical protein